MKIQISLQRGLMANSLLWILPEVFCVYMHNIPCFSLTLCCWCLTTYLASHSFPAAWSSRCRYALGYLTT